MNTDQPFELHLFHRDVAFSAMALANGIDALIVDFENKGKPARQVGFDTEINFHTLHDLDAVRALTDRHVICRVNGPATRAQHEIADILSAGANEVIVPMIQSLDDANRAVDAVANGARITLMVETSEALKIVPQLCALPIDRIYVGLNDLRISRGSSTIFEPLVDGVIDEIRSDVRGVQLGFGGLTRRGQGCPLPVHFLIDELARTHADFTFLRRSFYRDLGDWDISEVLQEMRADIALARTRDAAQTHTAREKLKAAVRDIGALHHA